MILDRGSLATYHINTHRCFMKIKNPPLGAPSNHMIASPFRIPANLSTISPALASGGWGGGGQMGADATPDFAELNTPLLCICKEVIFRLFLRNHQNFESVIFWSTDMTSFSMFMLIPMSDKDGFQLSNCNDFLWAS